MIVLGIVLLAAAIATAIVLIAQNSTATIDFHALGNTWNVHVYWALVAGMVIVLVALLGVAAMRAGTAHTWRARRERRELLAENRRLNRQVAEAPAVTTDPPAYAPTAPEYTTTRPVDQSADVAAPVDSRSYTPTAYTASPARPNRSWWSRHVHRTV